MDESSTGGLLEEDGHEHEEGEVHLSLGAAAGFSILSWFIITAISFIGMTFMCCSANTMVSLSFLFFSCFFVACGVIYPIAQATLAFPILHACSYHCLCYFSKFF
jgi:hypothetical protein